jgi:uncharacterized membrane protein (DUF485 family)
MENQRIITAAFGGGLVAALLSSVPYLNFINCFCCIGIALGGVVALLLYDRSTGSTHYINQAQTITLGISTGLIGAFLSLLIEWIVYRVYGHWDIRLIQSIMENMDEIPDYLEELRNELENQASQGFIWTATLFTNLVVYPIFCLIGSFVSRLILNKNRLRQ